MNDADRKEIQQYIITELEKREGEYIADFFENASEADKEGIAQDIALFMAQNARGYVKRDTAQPTRYLIDGADINTTVYGSTTVANQAGHAGPTLPNIINLESGFQAKLNARSEANQLDIKVQAGGGADCMFNFIVSECWATVVSEGRGTEGQSFLSLSECPFKVYSTVAAAVTQALVDFPNGSDHEPVIFVCHGTYPERNITWNPNTDWGVHIYGAGREATIVGNEGTGAATTPTFEIDGYVHFYNITIDDPSGAGSDIAVRLDSNNRLEAFNTEFMGTVTNTGTGAHVELSTCFFSSAGKLDITGTVICKVTDFEGAGTQLKCVGVLTAMSCFFDDCTTAVVNDDSNTLPTVVEACYFRDVGTAISFTGSPEFASITANVAHGVDKFVDMASMSSSYLGGIVRIDGNTADADAAPTAFLALPVSVSTAAGAAQHIVLSNNTAIDFTEAQFVTGADWAGLVRFGNQIGTDGRISAEGGPTRKFTGRVWYFDSQRPVVIGCIAFVARFGDTIVQVAAQTVTLTASATNYVEVNSSGTLSANTSAFTAGRLPLLQMVCGSAAGNSTYTSHVDVSGILYVQQAASGGVPVAAHNILDGGTVHLDSAADTVSQGSLIVGNSTPAWDELLIGVSGTVLRSDGTDAAWTTLAGAGIAPTPHAFVGADHSGDDDYTLTPNVDGIGVGGGDIDVYSDNGVTQTGEWDSTTGHIAIGTTAAAGFALNIQKALTELVSVGIYVSLSGGTNTGNLNGLQFSALSTHGSGTLALLQGVEGTVSSDGAGAVTDLSGASIYIGSSGAGAITRAYGQWLTTSGGWAGAKPATLYGIKIDNLGASGVTLAHGLHVAAQTATTARNVIIDALSLGVDAAVPAGSKLRVDGAVTLDGETAPGTPSADDIVIYNETGTDALKAKDDNGVARRLNVDHTVVALIDGATASTTVPFVLLGPMPHAGSVAAVYAKTNENVTIGATDWIGDIHKILAADLTTDGQGTTIYTTQANRPTIASMFTSAAAPDVTTFAAGDYFAFYTDQAGSGATYITVSMLVRYT